MSLKTVIHNEGPTTLDPASQACVELLEKVLADARAGTIRSCVVVVAGSAGPGAAFAGPDLGALNMGLDAAKQNLLAVALQPRKASPIIRPDRQ